MPQTISPSGSPTVPASIQIPLGGEPRQVGGLFQAFQDLLNGVTKLASDAATLLANFNALKTREDSFVEYRLTGSLAPNAKATLTLRNSANGYSLVSGVDVQVPSPGTYRCTLVIPVLWGSSSSSDCSATLRLDTTVQATDQVGTVRNTADTQGTIPNGAKIAITTTVVVPATSNVLNVFIPSGAPTIQIVNQGFLLIERIA